MIVTRDVSSWLYLLIGGSFVFTLLMVTRGFDKYGKPASLSAPPPLQPAVAKNEVEEESLSEIPIANQFLSESTPSRTRNIHHISPLPPKQTENEVDVDKKKADNPQEYSGKSLMEEAIDDERKSISKVMEGFEFEPGVQLDDLVMEKGGSPVRAMVATTWRSGSTFLGDIMDSHPAVYYHYEPLLHFDIRQARDGFLAEEGVRTLKELMNCDYRSLGDYLKYGKTHNWLFTHNKRLWKHCTNKGQRYQYLFCWNPEFLNRFCSLFPFQSIKTVRLRLNLTRQLVEDDSLNVKILLLVRDPRGTMQSRKHRDWCPGNPDCDEPAKLCGDLVSDFYSAQKLMTEFPDRYKVARYEDFSMDPYNNSADLFKFFGYSMHPQVETFLDSHTKTNIGGVSSTFRDSKTAPFKWREKLTTEEVFHIQKSCSEAMKLWGYEPLQENENLKELEPVIDLGNFKL